LKGRVIRSRIGKKSPSQTSTRRPKPWADLRLARGPSCLARADRSRDSEKRHQSQNVPIMAPLELRRPEDWPRRRGAEGGRGSETPHRTRRCYGAETRRPENARDAKPARWSSRGTSC
jgi:hypothetical protein